MKMWHKLLLIIACLALLAFSACGEKAPAPPKKRTDGRSAEGSIIGGGIESNRKNCGRKVGDHRIYRFGAAFMLHRPICINIALSAVPKTMTIPLLHMLK